MRKYLFYLVIIIIILIPLWMYLFWLLTPEKEMRILMLDKTMLNKKTQEHISLNWVLTNSKYVKCKDSLYDRFKDYYGFFPKIKFDYDIKDFNHLNDSMLRVFADQYDMVYYTDLYGIYSIEWFEENKKYYPLGYFDNEKIPALERSRKIYGGLTHKEMDVLEIMKEQKKLIITEFNIIGSPTPYRVRKRFQDAFDMRWSGWVGRYFSTLDTNINKEIPHWLKNNYIMQHDSVWPFTKSGIAFVRNDDWIEILENETHLNVEIPMIHTGEKFQDKYGLPAVMKYPFWFDIIYTGDTNEIVSEYRLNPNEAGAKILRKFRIPVIFPAVIEHEQNYLFHYFAGDFCDNPVTMKMSRLRGIHLFSWLFYEKSIDERYSFFWRFYRPLVKTILNSYYNNSIKPKNK
ncbi:MAG: hypothetical protein PHT69_06365 [Bacteroidales bacterium]|nr:hypothetical protein [Bacteroidales bacterium]